MASSSKKTIVSPEAFPIPLFLFSEVFFPFSTIISYLFLSYFKVDRDFSISGFLQGATGITKENLIFDIFYFLFEIIFLFLFYYILCLATLSHPPLFLLLFFYTGKAN